MTAVAGQLDIFDLLDAQEPRTTCPHCRHSWTGPISLRVHVDGSKGWPFGAAKYGKCANQSIRLYRVADQLHKGLQDDAPRYRTDLLGVILDAKESGCTDRQIQSVIAKAGDR